MKKKYLVIPLVAASLTALGQRPDSVYARASVSTTDVQALFAFYTQDGDHSAVTGGLGTEQLQVYSMSLSLDQQKDSVRSFRIAAGVDLISSASTDRIDYEMSSASRTDFRAYMNAGIGRRLRGKGFSAGVNTALSFESDYLSIGPGAWLSHENPGEGRNWTLAARVFFDDLRWFDHGRHSELVYPVEMRYKEWFDTHRRTSYNLEFSLVQVINRRMTLAIYPGVSLQTGLLATPFHRVYFSDETARVENLPQQRLKVPLGVQLNTFVGSRLIIRTHYRYYGDSFGIHAHTVSVEAPIKLSRIVSLIPLIRLYSQSAADHFRPYGEHDHGQSYYTSDYDLSRFESLKAGMGFRYAPMSRKGTVTFREVELRYATYQRSDGLSAHMISLFLNWDADRRARAEGRD